VVREAVIVDAVRTAGGRRHGSLSGWHPADLLAEVLAALVARTGIDPGVIDDVIVGCVTQVGAQGFNIARNAVLAAGWPESVPATTVDRQCGSSQQALHFAAQAVMAGAHDIVVAAGVETMSSVPMGAARVKGLGKPFGPRMIDRYRPAGGLVQQGISAELIADKWRLSREELDSFALRSHQSAARATEQGRFRSEIVPVKVKRRDRETGDVQEISDVLESDEGIRYDTSGAALADLKPVFRDDGVVTAGNSSQITDGASACLIMNGDAARAAGFRPRARITAFALVGVDPVMMLTGPIPATRKILTRCGLEIGDIDLIEINEAFASVVLAWQRELGADLARVNVNGGAIALGHPLGATGTKLFATVVNELERTENSLGLVVMCEGGGMANATIIERM
jgi:acetyl-CoA acyltransferase